MGPEAYLLETEVIQGLQSSKVYTGRVNQADARADQTAEIWEIQEKSSLERGIS
jgi:hypothetical protein